MANASYRRAAGLAETLARIIALGQQGKHEEAEAVADGVKVEEAKKRAFGRSATQDIAYEPRSVPARARFAGKNVAQVGASAVTLCHDDDYGPPTANKHKLVAWFERYIDNAMNRGLPAAVPAEGCAAAVLDKNARRISVQRRDVVYAVNELLLRIEELGGGPVDLVPMLESYESPLKQATPTPVASNTNDDAPVVTESGTVETQGTVEPPREVGTAASRATDAMADTGTDTDIEEMFASPSDAPARADLAEPTDATGEERTA